MGASGKEKPESALLGQIRVIIQEARKSAYRTVNHAMIGAYWKIGRSIVLEEQNGEERARYGTQLIKVLSEKLTLEHGKGFDETNLKLMRKFYLAFSKGDSLRHQSGKKGSLPDEALHGMCLIRTELSWTHYRMLVRVDEEEARSFYMHEAADQNWSTRQLERNINTFSYQRMLSSRTNEKTGRSELRPDEFLKDPYVFEFLGFDKNAGVRESELETALLNKTQDLMLEMGKGFAFVSRQKRISTETKDFYVDLVFYNYLLKCFVLVDLKVGALTHQDIGQMDMYVRIFEEAVKPESENPTIGIILCSDKDETIVRYSVLQENRQLFASRYKLHLPTEGEIRNELERQLRFLRPHGV